MKTLAVVLSISILIPRQESSRSPNYLPVTPS